MWQVRHTGSPQAIRNLSLEQVADGLRDGLWEPTDEVCGPGEETWTALESHPQLADLAWELETPEPRRRDDATHLDMNALIDVCLVLLIFFILTTTYAATVQKVVPMPPSQDTSGAKIIPIGDVTKRMIRLEASRGTDGRIIVSVMNQPVDALAADGSIDREKLRRALLPYTRGDDRRSEMLLDARRISWGTVIAIQDAAALAGVRSIHLVEGTVKSAPRSPTSR